MTDLKQTIDFKRNGIEYLVEYEYDLEGISLVTVNDIEWDDLTDYFIDVVIEWIQEELTSVAEDDGQDYADYLYHTNKEDC